MINEILLLNNLITKELNKYLNMELLDICSILNIEANAKNKNRVVIDAIFNHSRQKDKINELFKLCNCNIKTLSLEWNYNLKESISLSNFKFCDLFNEEWEESQLKSYFENTLFLFVVFKKEINGTVLYSFKFWKMPSRILNKDVKNVWLKTKDLITNGNIVRSIDENNRFITYFPTSGDTSCIHVRPHAQNRNDTYPLPVPDKLTLKTEYMKHSFWLNSNFVKNIILEDKYYE